MPDSPVYIASDVHWGAVAPENERAFLDWLHHAASRSRRIVLNGDLFDFWFEYRTGIPPGNEPLLEALKEVVDAGVRIDFLGGNHDWWGGRYLTEEIGVHLHFRPQRWTLAGRTAWVGHGDGQGPGDHGYKALSAFIRNPLFVFAFRQLPVSIGGRIAQRATSTHSKGRPPNAHELEVSDRLERWGTGLLKDETELELVATGHTHNPLCIEVAPGRFYVNSGDWVWHRSYIRLDEGEPPRLYGWDGSPLEARED